MSYFYEDYSVNETEKSYLVKSQVPGDDEKKVRISKDVIEKINANEDKEMLVILCAVIEFTRFDAKEFDKHAETTIIKFDEFREKLELILAVKNIEDVITEISGMKYHEIKEYFNN